MIISVEELRKHIQTDETDEMIEERLRAIELMVQEYTNNRFHQKPFIRIRADVVGGVFASDYVPFKVGDTVQVTMGDSATDCGLYTVKEVSDDSFTVNEPVEDMWSVKVTKVQYKTDVKLGVVNMMQWDLKNREKVGIQSETISRHSVTYSSMDGDNSAMGYPKAVLGFLKPYKKAKF